MNDDPLTDKEAERLGRAYRAVSGERTPAELDHAVLQDAQQALSAGGRATNGGWLAPLAVAAALVLGVAVLFEMPDSNWTGTTNTETRSEPVRPGQQTSAPLPNDRSLRKPGVANQARQGKVEGAVTTDDGNNALAERVETFDAGVDVRHAQCDSDETSSAETWWRCIEALRNSGEAEAAEAERLRLQQRYPESQRNR